MISVGISDQDAKFFESNHVRAAFFVPLEHFVDDLLQLRVF